MPTNSGTCAHGKYLIRFAQYGDHWRARGYRGAKPRCEEQKAITQAGAVDAVRVALDEMDAIEQASRRATGAPSVEAYRNALAALNPLSKHHEAMLAAHLEAPNHIMTVTGLANAAGYDDLAAANVHYGKLGRLIAEELDWIPRFDGDTVPTWTLALATPVGDSDDALETLEFQWRLRPEVVKALRGD